jgi:cysteinyl-tRNA synthetase
LLSHHYRDPWEYYEEQITAAKKAMGSIEAKVNQFSNSQKNQKRDDAMEQFTTALSDDLDTPKALEILNETVEKENITEAKKMMEVLGFVF